MQPSFERYYLNDALADVSITLYEETHEPGKRKWETQVPAHSMVLAVTSSYCEAKLTHWSNPSSDGTRYSIELSMPQGQLHLGEKLVRGMYADGSSYVQDLDQGQLLQLLALADRYGVPKVQQAVLHAFAVLDAELQWDAAMALLDLPISCEGLEEYDTVVEKAERKMHWQLGHLEVVWASEQLQQLLLGLSHAALLRLLRSHLTAVDNECTIVYTILQWWHHQPAEEQQIDLLKQLMQQVRLHHCSQLYITTVLMNNPLIKQCFTMDEWSTAISASVYQHFERDDHTVYGLQHLLKACPEAFKRYPAWSAAARQCKADFDRLQVPTQSTWHLAVTELQPLAEQIFGGNQEGGTVSSTRRVLCGQPMQFTARLHVRLSENDDVEVQTPVLCIGLYVEILELAPGAVRHLDLLSLHARSTPGPAHYDWEEPPQCVTSRANTFGYDEFITLGPARDFTSWPMVLRALEESLMLRDGNLWLDTDVVIS